MNPISLAMPEAVLFDFDGILVDSEPMHHRAKRIDLDNTNLAKLVAAKSEAFLRGLRGGVTAYPGAVSLIESLRASGLPLTLCSGASVRTSTRSSRNWASPVAST